MIATCRADGGEAQTIPWTSWLAIWSTSKGIWTMLGPKNKGCPWAVAQWKGPSSRDSGSAEVVWHLVEGGNSESHAGITDVAGQRLLGGILDVTPHF